jgi:hypothetical protein
MHKMKVENQREIVQRRARAKVVDLELQGTAHFKIAPVC